MQPDWQEIAARLTDEGLLAISKASRLIPAERGRHGYVSTTTMVRWIVKGKLGVKLEAVRGVGSTWYTSKQAVTRFLARLSQLESANRIAEDATPTISQHERRLQEAREAREAIAAC